MAVSLAAPSEEWLWECYRAGDTDTIAAAASSLPETSASGMFFRAIFTKDAGAAIAIYMDILARFPNSEAYLESLRRIRDYYTALGKPDSARLYDGMMISGSREGMSPAPIRQDASTKPPATYHQQPPRGGWTVQVGAFRNKAGAEATGRRVAPFGEVTYLERPGKGGKLTMVRVGRFDDPASAERLAGQIQKAIGLAGVVCRAD